MENLASYLGIHCNCTVILKYLYAEYCLSVINEVTIRFILYEQSVSL